MLGSRYGNHAAVPGGRSADRPPSHLYKQVGSWRDYLFGETAYIVLSHVEVGSCLADLLRHASRRLVCAANRTFTAQQ
ncbi:MAG TPA: hypothetical protein VMR52_01620 [Dehalococcoidia bacterium]|nr:hypothetical protein [Dehalococcoidia bacterium]